jgi:uncharacterized protein YjbI with pentapeptide repeats
MDKEALNTILDKHLKWVNSEDGGERASLEGADLRSANLWGADLRSADLRSADLEGANLRSADLEGADLRRADLSGADLRRADLRRADLSGADLEGANLWGATGNLKHLKSIFLEQYQITYTSDILQIGCERHPITEWWEYDDERILNMDGKSALKFWRKWKDQIKQIIEMSPAEPTGYKEDA